MTIDALIFDCDGTLTDSMPAHYVAWKLVLEARGMQLEEARFYSLGGMPTHKIVELLAAEQGVPADPLETAHAKEEAFLEVLHLVKPIEPVVRVAREARGRLPLAVASGGWRRIVERQLAHIGVADWFAAVVTAEDTSRHKPEPDVFLEAARRLGVPPARCRVYEDADLGVEAARRAGMQVIDIRSWNGA